MPIRDVTPKGEIDRFLNGVAERMRQALVYNLSDVGEQAVNAARSLPSLPRTKKRMPPHQPNYIDDTANLRSSIGYVIAEDGKIIGESDFKPVKGGEEGARKGRELAEQLASEHGKGIVLIVVAGESYARYVAAKGYDVLDSAELLAQRLVPQMLKQLKLT